MKTVSGWVAPPNRGQGMDHLAIQAAFQEKTHNAVSKTITLPADTTREALGGIFREAHRLGLKGVTVYRYGSVPGQPLEVGEPRS